MQIDSRVSKQMMDMQLLNNMGESSGSNNMNTTGVFSSLLDQAGQAVPESTVGSGMITKENGLLWLQLGPAKGMTAPVTANVVLNDTEGSSKTTAYDDIITEASRKYGVPESLIKAVIDTESSFNPNVTSSAGAKGLMQLMDATAKGLGVSNSFDASENIDAGVRYLSYQLKRFDGNVNMALAAYNAGPSRVERLGVTNDAQLMSVLGSLPVETQKYITKIQNAREKYIG